MASTTATATMAAAGFDKRASTAASSLQTPGSASFPSELRSPLAGSPGFLKREHDLKTPITPPSAYLDFLRNMSPAIASPTVTGTSFSFNDRPKSTSSDSSSDKSSFTAPISQPPLSRNTSYDSNSSNTSTASDRSVTSIVNVPANSNRNRPESPRIIIPPSPFVKPGPRSARTPRRLHIPQSPFSPANGLPSAHSISSPYTSTPLSAAPWSASFSPRDVDPEINGKPGRMSVRQVVTRTVTYCRTPLEPAPKGKRRKIEGPSLVAESKTSPELLPSSLSSFKQEKTEDEDSVATNTAVVPLSTSENITNMTTTPPTAKDA